MRDRFRKIGKANLFSLLMLGKFAVLLGSDWITGQDNFGTYALVGGLVGGIVALASLRARILVLSKIQARSDFRLFQFLLILSGIAAVLLSLFLFRDMVSMMVLGLIAAQKLAENFLLASASFTQNCQGRDLAFRDLNITAVLVFGAFSIGLFWSLEIALVLELTVLLLAIALQDYQLREPVSVHQIGFGGLITQSLSFSLAAGLNAGLISLFLASGLHLVDEETLMLFAKLFAVQAVFARLAIGNVIYFAGELRSWVLLNSTVIGGFAVLAWTLCLLASNFVWIAIAFTVLNLMNIILRQSIMSSKGAVVLIPFHAFELISLWLLTIWFQIDLFAVFYALTSLRLVRIFWFTHILASNVRTEAVS